MKKAWLKHYPKRVPETLTINPNETLQTLFDESCEKYPDRIAYSCEGEILTYARLFESAMHFASYLQNECHCKKGDRVAIMLPNILHYPVALFGVVLAGCVAVNLNPLDKARNLKHQLVDAEVKVILVLEHFISELEQVVHETPVEQVIVSSVGAMFRPFKRLIVNFIMRYIKRAVPKWHLKGTIHFRQALKKGMQTEFTPVVITQSDLALIQYTGGTTGKAKGVLLTHANMIANLYQAKTWTDEILNDQGEVVVTALPLYHIFSLLANCLLFLKYGAENILIINPKEVNRFVKQIAKRRYTAITGVNTLFNAMIQEPCFRNKSDFSRLKLCLGGGMAVQKTVADEWQTITGVPICQAYGMTETSPAVSINPVDLLEFNSSVGLPLSSTEISVRNAKGKEVGFGEEGELWVRGPQVMQGYLNLKTETRKVLTKAGWLKTGDVVIVDTEGYIYIVDRVKDIIIVSGFNVYPAEIENTVREMPGVSEVAAVGIPCNIKGEQPKVFIVKDNPSRPTADEVRAYCYEKLAAYKVPAQVTFVPTLPKTNVGKILKTELRKK